MIAVLDTNVLARFLLGDDKEQETKACAVLAKAKKAVVPTVVF